jgi:uncharacterized protein YbjT (DUF2867 family)
MKIVLYGATGMVGQAVLRACLLDPRVRTVVSVGRTPIGRQHPKLREIITRDVADARAVVDDFSDARACLFCLGVSSAGMSEERYRKVTYDLTLSVARTAAAAHPGMTFVYVSGAGTDSTAQGRSMWARVKGRTENDIFALPLRGYAFRPGFIQPVHGERSRTRLYRLAYLASAPLTPVLRRVAPKYVMTSDDIGRAMLRVAESGADKQVLENLDIVALARA